MPVSHYDAAVVGMHPAALLCAALLTKRGFRVLVVGQNMAPLTYELGGVELPRGPYCWLAAHSPATRRVLSELGIHQSLRRHTTSALPVQVALPGHRLALPTSPEETATELEREFPEIRRPIETFLETVSDASRDLDETLSRELMWPPTTFFERRRFSRALAGQPFGRDGNGIELMRELPAGHPFRTAVHMPTAFVCGTEVESLSSLGLARLFSSWLGGPVELERGLSTFISAVTDKFVAFGGELRKSDRVTRIRVRRNRAVGIHLEEAGEEIGCEFLIGGCELPVMLRLLDDRRPFEQLFERVGEPQPCYFRYSLNAVVDTEVLPVGLGRHIFFHRRLPKRVRSVQQLWLQVHPSDARGRSILSAQVLLPRKDAENISYVERLRDEVLAALQELIPFLDRHIILVDSPHDGREGQDLRQGSVLAPRQPWTRGANTMERLYTYPVYEALGVCALPVRTPIRRLLLCNGQVVPGLGQEGDFLAAWSAAGLVSRADRKNAWRKRRVWTRIDGP